MYLSTILSTWLLHLASLHVFHVLAAAFSVPDRPHQQQNANSCRRPPAVSTAIIEIRESASSSLPWPLTPDPALVRRRRRETTSVLFASLDDDTGGEEDDDDKEEDEIDLLADKDWRAFRAKLVMGEPAVLAAAAAAAAMQKEQQQVSSSDGGGGTNATRTTTMATTSATRKDDQDSGDLDGIGALFSDSADDLLAATTSITSTRIPRDGTTTQLLTPLDPSQWAYDSGKVIEQGAVILGGVEQDYGFGLKQQYFHKAAILVLDHEESTFTKGIILNRPTDITLPDDVNKGVSWKVWFGGDVQGITSANPEYVCLHTITNPIVAKVSVPVMNDIQWTTFDTAKTLVKGGLAKPEDFWLFAGYAGWARSQLMGELERKCWYMVATDSQTLLRELQRLTSGADPRDAGLDTWSLLMNMIGRADTARQSIGRFDDLMLKEWAYKHLLSTEMKRNVMTSTTPTSKKIDKEKVVRVGALVRATPEDRSPFLLESQELHKAIVLVIREDEMMTTGVILNIPGAKPLEIRVKEDGKSKQIQIPLRFGGPYAIKGEEPLLWLHCNSLLKATKVGTPIGLSPEAIWKCTANDMMSALVNGLATIQDFLIVTGVSIWTKDEREAVRGMTGEVKRGHFELIEPNKNSLVWEELRRQTKLTPDNIDNNLQLALRAWEKAGGKEVMTGMPPPSNGGTVPPLPLAGIGENFDEEDDSLVFKSDKKVSQLADDALRYWIAAYLLGNPSLGVKDNS